MGIDMPDDKNLPKEDFGRPGIDGMLPLMAGMLCGAGNIERQSRKHELQQMIFMMLKPARSKEDARSFLTDMRDSLESTEKAVDVMVW